MPSDAERPMVTAARARRISVRWEAGRERVRSSLAVVPVFGLLAGWVLARVLSTRALNENLAGWIDDVYGRIAGDERSWVWFSAATLQTVTATVAAAMLTFVGVVFSLSILALQVASSQLSPRIMRTFVRSRIVTWTLAVFLATFVYALTVLSAIQPGADGVRAFEPFIAYYVLLGLVGATLGMFVAYVSHVVRLIRIHHILDAVADETRAAVAHRVERVHDRREVPAPDLDGAPVDRIEAVRSGVVDIVGIERLASLAGDHGCVLVVRARVGDHVGAGQVLVDVHPAETAGSGTTAAGAPPSPPSVAGLDHRRVLGQVHLGAERALQHDPAFGLRQIVDVAVRALSAAVNDPTTAVQALDRVADLLLVIGRSPDQPDHWLVPGGGRVGVVVPTRTWDELVDLALTETVCCGASSPQVTRRIAALLDDLTESVPAHRHPALERWRDRLERSVESGVGPDPLAPDRAGLG